MSKAHVSNNSGRIDWYSPAEIVEAGRVVLGGFDLDPCSSAEANSVIQAARFYSVEDDGLARAWSGRVWMNPPYADGMIGPFTRKLVESYKSGNITEAVVLVNNATETDWFQRLARSASTVCLLKGRLHFWHPDRPEGGTPLQGQAVMYFGARPESFAAAFKKRGAVYFRHEMRHDNDGEMFGQRKGRPAVFARAMTAAERQKRSRMLKRVNGGK